MRLPLPNKPRLIGLAPLAAVAALAACSPAPEGVDFHDPYEPVNRVTHEVNRGLDTVALRPASQVYGNLVPGEVRGMVDNAASNLALPSAILNNILQGNGEDAFHNGFRFMLNSTIGLLGLVDVATDAGLEERSTGFADTLATWGVDEGAYVVLPILGPSNERDAVGAVVEIVTNPVGTLFGDETLKTARGLSLAERTNQRFTFTGTIDPILYGSADSYTQMRLFYLDSRRFQLGTSDDPADTDIYDDLYDGVYDE
jgi:phospholipid-binding lipoprotein MlaA